MLDFVIKWAHMSIICTHFSRTFKVEIRFGLKIPLRTIALPLKGNVSDATQDALRIFRYNFDPRCF